MVKDDLKFVMEPTTCTFTGKGYLQRQEKGALTDTKEI